MKVYNSLLTVQTRKGNLLFLIFKKKVDNSTSTDQIYVISRLLTHFDTRANENCQKRNIMKFTINSVAKSGGN